MGAWVATDGEDVIFEPVSVFSTHALKHVFRIVGAAHVHYSLVQRLHGVQVFLIRSLHTVEVKDKLATRLPFVEALLKTVGGESLFYVVNVP